MGWDVDVKQFGITTCVVFVLMDTLTYATKIIHYHIP